MRSSQRRVPQTKLAVEHLVRAAIGHRWWGFKMDRTLSRRRHLHICQRWMSVDPPKVGREGIGLGPTRRRFV